MYRIGEKLARRRKCLAILNGESVGQVASQTLESINVIEQVATIPVIRPLAMFDKKDIIDAFSEFFCIINDLDDGFVIHIKQTDKFSENTGIDFARLYAKILLQMLDKDKLEEIIV